MQFRNPLEKSQEVANIDFANERIYDRSLSWLGIFTSKKSGGVKLVLCGHTVIYQSTKNCFSVCYMKF
jgi:hypothetical protein